MSQAQNFYWVLTLKILLFIDSCHYKAICIHKLFSMKYFDISKEVILALKKSFFSKCTLNFLTKFVVTSKLKYFFLADRYYALRGYNTWPLAPKRYIITNQAPLFSLMLCNFRKNKYLFNAVFHLALFYFVVISLCDISLCGYYTLR